MRCSTKLWYIKYIYFFQVVATDADKGHNAQIVYSLAASPDGGFYINEKTGILFTNSSIRYNPQQPVIQLVVAARDKGKPSMSSVAAVRIQISDVNDNTPKFSRQKYK